MRFRGRKVTAPGPERGVVFQEYALFAWLTARQNVEFGLKARGVPKAERRDKAMRFLEMVDLARAADRYPHELSGGMRQRIAVARALVNEPQVLLMDEPFAAVDAITRVTLQDELLKLWRQFGISVVFITHNIDEAIFLGQRVIVMSAHPGSVKSKFPSTFPTPATAARASSATSTRWSAASSMARARSARHEPRSRRCRQPLAVGPEGNSPSGRRFPRRSARRSAAPLPSA